MDYPTSIGVDFEARVKAHEAVQLRTQKFPTEALRLLAEEVLSRLASRYINSSHPQTGLPTDEDIDTLADALLSADPDEGLAYVVDLKAQGVSRDTIYLSYLAGAARRLGERWSADTLSFSDATIGAGRLYVILRALRPVLAPEIICPETSKTALFFSAPGEDHVLGVTMAADMFRERGWNIVLRTGASHDELVQVASERECPIVGVSASSRRMLVPLTRLIASLRVVNPAAYIVVSGELTEMEDDLAKIVDADFVAHSAPEAIEELQRFVSALEVS